MRYLRNELGIDMRPENAIEVEHVQKSFRLYRDRGNELKDIVTSPGRLRYTKHEVLRDISFTVKRGECVGILGENGCGKSTLLKLLSRIMYPDSGSVQMTGRVSSLIELGAGFHPDMSGRDNIFINASIFGLDRKEIRRRLPEIIAFSGLSEFIDNPVRTYSSGMYMRLAFSVAINVDADILLIDEILSVGDAGFQAKCISRLKEIVKSGTTVVIVSHALSQLEELCTRSIWIKDGGIHLDGRPREVHPAYLEYMGKLMEKGPSAAQLIDSELERKAGGTGDGKRFGSGDVRIQSVTLLHEDGESGTVFRTGEDMEVRLLLTHERDVEDASFGIGIFREDGTYCYGTNTKLEHLPAFALRRDGILNIRLSGLPLLPGVYTMDLAVEHEGNLPVDYIREACRFEMRSLSGEQGLLRIPHTWELTAPEN